MVDNGLVSHERAPTGAIDPHRVAADDAPVMTWVCDADAAVVWVNRYALEFTGVAPEDALQGGWMGAIHPDDRPIGLAEARRAIAEGQPVELVHRIRRHDGVYRWVLQRGVPLGNGPGSSGLVVSCTDVDDLKVTENVADLSLRSERAARAEVEAAVRLLAKLQDLTAAFAAALTPESVYDGVVAEAIAATDATAGALFLLDPDGRTMRAERAAGYLPDAAAVFDRFSVDDDLPAAEAVRTGRPVFIGNIESAPARVRAVAFEGGRRAVTALPLVIGGTPVGALVLSYPDEQRFDVVQREFLEAVARQCAVALERTRLYEAEQAGRLAAEAAQHRLGFLAEATRALASSLDRREILTRLTRLSVSHLCDLVEVWLPHDGVLERTTAAHTDQAVEPELRVGARRLSVPLGSGGPLATCFATGHEQLLHVDEAMRVRAGLSSDLARDPRFGVHTTLVVPITARRRVLGVMTFSLIGPARAFRDADVAVALELGARAGTAMENAELFAREHSVAEILQQAILPQALPPVPGFELSARYLPATSGVEVGGDWYDAFDLRDGRIGIAVGDVAGHGLRAAAIMGQLRNGLRAYAIDGDPPSQVLSRLNRLLHDTEQDTIATLVYGILDPATGLLQWCCAGHPPPVSGDGSTAVHLAATVCLVLGVDPDAEFVDAEVVLAPGTSLVLYTDGLVERRHEHLGEGLERLRLSVERNSDDGVEQLCRRVVREMLGDAPRNDDVCLLALWRRPQG